MKQLTVAAVNGGMVRYRSTKAAQQNIARLCRGQGHPVKAGDRHIVQVKVLTVAPPVILAMKIRHFSPRQMISIPEQRVTVRHPVLKAPSCQMWHTAEFVNVTPADQPPGSALLSAAAGQPRSAGQPTGMTVDQCHNLPCISARSQSSGAIRKYASGSAEIFTQGIYHSLRRAYHEAARLRRRTPPGMRQNR